MVFHKDLLDIIDNNIIRYSINENNNYFTLNEIYEYLFYFKKLYPNNNNLKAKIRQQLQLLRNKGYIEFIGNGEYFRLNKND